MKAEQSCSSTNSDGTVKSFANQRGQQHCCANSPTGLRGCWCSLNKTQKNYVSITEWHTAIYLADALQQLSLYCLGQGHFSDGFRGKCFFTLNSPAACRSWFYTALILYLELVLSDCFLSDVEWKKEGSLWKTLQKLAKNVELRRERRNRGKNSASV